MKGYIENISGKKFNRLRAIGFHKSVNNKHYWICLCQCGKLISIRKDCITSGNNKGCGCRLDVKTHGLYSKNNKYLSKLLSVFNSMKNRCYCSTSQAYSRYGGRGIIICDEWKNNANSFIQWSLNNGYQIGLSIDRIDNDGNYSPENCRWTNMATQNRNMSSNKIVIFKGKNVKFCDICLQYNLNYRKIYNKLKRLKTNVIDDLIESKEYVL